MQFGSMTPRLYQLAMTGAAKGLRDRTKALAHQIEWMARQKVLQPLHHYLADDGGNASVEQANAAIIQQFARLSARGLATIETMN